MKIPAVEQIMCFFFVFSEKIFDHHPSRRIITIIPLAQVLGQAPCAELSKVEFDWHSEARAVRPKVSWKTGKTETVRRHARDSIGKDGGMISVEL